MKTLSLKNKTIICVCAFIAVFVALILVATFFDFQVSEILTKNALEPGNYLADDLYGVVGEAIGTSPIYLLLAACTGILCWFFIKCFDDNKYKNWFVLLGIAFALVGIVAWWYYIKDIFKYLIEHAGATLGGIMNGDLAADTSVYEYRHDSAVVVCELLIAATMQALTVLTLRPLKKETLKKLIWWVIAGLAACIVANILIMLVKEPIGRMRFRSINSDVGQQLIKNGEIWWGDNGYTRWYVRNGQPDESIINMFVSKYPGADDAFKSFPSGHTCAAGMSYAMIMLPDVVDFKHKKAGKIACWVTPILITMLVAISRIVVGAHYMSDVTFGGTIAFVCMIIAREVFICKGSHFFALFPKLAKRSANDTQIVESGEVESELANESIEDVDIDDINEDIAISSEEADVTAKEIADNLRDGGIIE